MIHIEGGSLAEQLWYWTFNPEVPSACPVLTASWICSWYSQVQILSKACKIANWFASYQLGF